MSCHVCKRAFATYPCKPDLSVEDGLVKEHIFYNGIGQSKTLLVYELLSSYCPCKTCIVKVMCHRKCDEYINRINNQVILCNAPIY